MFLHTQDGKKQTPGWNGLAPGNSVECVKWALEPLTPPSASEPLDPHFLSSITRLSLASWAPRHVTSPGSGAQGHGQQGGVTGCGESRAWARAGSRCSKKPDSQDFRWLGYSPSQNIFENHNKTALIGV